MVNIEKIQKLNSQIESFRDCYEGNPLWAQHDEPVTAESLIEFLIEHPELQQIANNIAALNG